MLYMSTVILINIENSIVISKLLFWSRIKSLIAHIC
jgi:hypothetical protein